MSDSKFSKTAMNFNHVFDPKKQAAILFDKNFPITDQRSLVDRQINIPVITEHDLLVEIQAVSVNPVDTKLRQTGLAAGNRILGYDACGIVKKIGRDVTRFRIGDRVYYAGTTQRPGSNENFQAIDERLVGRAPQKFTAAQTAAMPLTSLTAYEILVDKLGLTFQNHAAEGKKMLVINGAGGVGSILLQMAAYLGIQLSVTAHSQQSIDWLKQYPIDKIYDYENLDENLAGEKFDYIVFLYDPSAYWQTAVKHIKAYGQLVSIVGTETPLNLGSLKNIAADFKWEYMFAKSDFDHNILSQGQALDRIAILFDAGILKSTLNVVFDQINASNLRKAYALIESGRTQGKFVLNGPFQGAAQ
ncbi:zinc-binding alcohol dehydrogenase family protein [Oenococcus sicerae]|uniref:zinc-binding alcohol dehydrogenase family protein n=1 Tax=Oenococcus sicerae TaxID=2203724 RepID=UPI0010B0E1A2|nr:Zinc-type alcohol dehydrogenase-like protein [Oenococcus sicerae]